MYILNKNSKKTLTGSLIAITLLAIIGYKLKGEKSLTEQLLAFGSAMQTDKWWLTLSIILMAPLSWITESFKWQFLIRKIQPLSLGTAFASVLTGMSIAMVSPGKSGDFAGRILYLRSHSRLRGAIASLVGSFGHILATFAYAIPSFLIVFFYSNDLRTLLLGVVAILAGSTLAWFYFRLHRFDFSSKKKNKLTKILTALKILKRYNSKDLRWVILFSAVKFFFYTTQFVLVTWLFGSELSFFISFFTAAAMFWLIMVIPSFFIADVLVRGAVANFLFVSTAIVASATPILAGTYIIWLINWVLPSLCGALILLLVRLFKKNKEGDNLEEISSE